jgi:hypothetical protein
MTLAELIAGLLQSQEASVLNNPTAIYSMKLVLSDNTEVNGATIVKNPKDGNFDIVLSDGMKE